VRGPGSGAGTTGLLTGGRSRLGGRDDRLLMCARSRLSASLRPGRHIGVSPRKARSACPGPRTDPAAVSWAVPGHACEVPAQGPGRHLGVSSRT